jgi:predicted acetyltransferase
MTDVASALALRRIDPDDDATLDTWFANQVQVFTAPWVPTAERRDFRREVLRAQRLTGAFDGDRLVGTYRSWDWTLTVPGGSVTADAVSSVTVLPTHRRRGALTALITADLALARERGVAAAVLIASETPIYGRYGFGPATECAGWEVDVRSARLRPGVPRDGTLEIVTLAGLRPIAPAVFEAARGAGATDRDPAWWDVLCEITPMPGEPRRPQAAVVHRDGGGAPQGYLIYSWKDHWDHGRVSRTVATVHDFQAATPSAYAALWGFLVELDLVATVRAENRPIDEPLPWLLTDARAARRTGTTDMLWARVLDPVAALTARRYAVPGRVVLEIADPAGHAAGTFALQIGTDGVAAVAPTARPADLTLGVDVLSAVWLGGGDLRAATAAGRAVPHRAGAVEQVATMFRTVGAPWTGTWF